MISNIGLVEQDINNVGSKEVNVDIHATGDYEGTVDATIVIEVLAGGTTFRWKKHATFHLPVASTPRGRRVHTAAVLKTSCMILNPWKESPSGLGAHKST